MLSSQQTQAPQGSSTTYEVALYGEFQPKDLKAIMNRFSLHSESCQPMHYREVLLEPLDAQYQRQNGQEPTMLRAQQDVVRPETGWALYSYLKAESTKVQATVRPWATVNVLGNGLQFASGLGYVRRSQIYKRGYTFRRGSLVVQMFQQEQADPKTQQPIPAHAETLWQVEVKTVSPVRISKDTPLEQYIDAVLEVQNLMRGLLDLRRQDQ